MTYAKTTRREQITVFERGYDCGSKGGKRTCVHSKPVSWSSDSLQPNQVVESANRSTQMGYINSLDQDTADEVVADV